MKFVTVFLVLLALTASTFAAPLTNSQYEALFSRFLQQYGKVYNGISLVSKYNTFVDNLNQIMKHNMKGDSSYTVAMNQYGDLTQEEFAARLTGLNKKLKSQANPIINKEPIKSSAVPDSFDWREKNVVNEIVNQDQCGSCWAFSTLTPLESLIAIKGGPLYKLSEQQLIDCSGETGNEGCNGGLVDLAYDYLIKSGGACTAEDYKYTGRDESCKKSCTPVAKVSAYELLIPKDESNLRNAVALRGPVSIGISAGNFAFQFYNSGILDNSSCNVDLDHAVSIVGYGSENGKDYWIVRNSWGKTWGEKGHIRIVRNKNMCRLAEEPYLPILDQ